MENHDDINGILQRETDQEPVVERIVAFDCAQNLTMSKTFRC